MTGPEACVQGLNSAVCPFTDQGDVFPKSSPWLLTSWGGKVTSMPGYINLRGLEEG